MSDKDDKIINFHKRTSNKQGSPDKIKAQFANLPYIKLTKDANGNYFNEETLREYSKKVCYILTLMKKNPPSVALYKYKVEQCSLIDFLKEIEKNKTYGELVDIEKYISEDLA